MALVPFLQFAKPELSQSSPDLSFRSLLVDSLAGKPILLDLCLFLSLQSLSFTFTFTARLSYSLKFSFVFEF